MAKTIRWFMWGYQQYFQVSADYAAKEAFSKLDPRLNPRAFLIGILTVEKKNAHPVCVEPEDCGYDPDLFYHVLLRASEWQEEDPDRHMFYPDPDEQDAHDRRLYLRSIWNATQEAFDKEDQYSDAISFCGTPVLVHGYLVCAVLQFRRSIYQEHYTLKRSQTQGPYRIATSFLDALIFEYHESCAKALTEGESGGVLRMMDRESDELIRRAARLLMYTPARAGCNDEGLHGLFDVCNTISLLRYEGHEGVGRMLVARRNHSAIDVVMELQTPVGLRDYRAVRKLLEMSSGELCLVTDSAYVYSLGRLNGTYDPAQEDLFVVRFTGDGWELSHDAKAMMWAKYGQPHLPRFRFDVSKLRSDLVRLFPGIVPDSVTRLVELVSVATEQKRGTTVVITKGAASEAERLDAQCTGIAPLLLNANSGLIPLITTIDGALLIDPEGRCHAIGVILDGIASKKGKRSRGGRYNSAVRYADSTPYACLIVVVSEDGSIDLIPELNA